MEKPIRQIERFSSLILTFKIVPHILSNYIKAFPGSRRAALFFSFEPKLFCQVCPSLLYGVGFF